jgi:GxxExxY protein
MRREVPSHLKGMPEWERAGRIIAAFYETYNTLKFGYFESVYRDALIFELNARGMRTQREMPVQVLYKGHPVGSFRLDLVVDERVVVELKAGKILSPTDTAS